MRKLKQVEIFGRLPLTDYLSTDGSTNAISLVKNRALLCDWPTNPPLTCVE